MDDFEAITRLQRGDTAGLTFLVQRYQARAVQTAYLITQDRTTAEDVVQGTFVQIYHSIQHIDPRRPFPPYLFKSVMNAAVRAARRDQRDFSLDEDNGVESFAERLPDSAPGLDDEAEHAELREQVRGALAQLSPEQRAAVVLRYFLDFSEAEMAHALDAPAGTIKWRLHTARKRLRSLLGEG